MSEECGHKIGGWEAVWKGEDIYTGEEIWEEEFVEHNTYEDVDLHRYRCTQCGQIFYYSERARKYYEDGEGEL